MKIQFPLVEGNLQVVVSNEKGEGVFLHGDRAGLLSLAEILRRLAELDQGTLPSLPDAFASEHIHLEPNFDLSKNSTRLTVGRLDDKHGSFDETFEPRTRKRSKPIVNIW
jgi:hypothetical protein